MKNYNLNFHQTFKPEAKYISSLLEISSNYDYLTVKEISNLTGIPTGESSGKVEPHINYANYMGLISYERKDNKYCLHRTMLGETVYNEDPGFQEELTILLTHSMLLDEVDGADLWAYILNVIMPKYNNSINKDILFKELELRYGDKINIKNFAPFLGSYESLFDSINVINIRDNEINRIQHYYNKDYIYLYCYILYNLWEKTFPNQDEISSIELEKLNFGNKFGWSPKEELSVLEHLADKMLIRLNRQLVPYTILKLNPKEKILDKIYSCLF